MEKRADRKLVDPATRGGVMMDLAHKRIPSWRQNRIERGYHVWRNMNPEQKKELIKGLMERDVRVTPDNCLIEASSKHFEEGKEG